jgi:ribose transport system substrate-binding protein
MTKDTGHVQAVVRACDIVKAFRHEGEELQLADVMERTALHRTTAFRLLQSLVHGGLLERTARGVYRCPFPPAPGQRFRLGFAAQTDSDFSRGVTESLQRAAAKERVDLITVNNRYSPKEALRNADLLVRERVDLVLEFQTYERVAPIIASKFLEARIPVIAIEIPHPGAVYFGANNYQAGLIAGRALGRWAKENWDGAVEQIILLGLPIAGPLTGLRITGTQDGLRSELPRVANMPVLHLDGKGDFDQILSVVRRSVRRNPRRRTLVGTVNDMCALAALRAFEEAGAGQMCAVVGQNAILEARNELRRPGTRLLGTVAYFPERYGDELIPLALNLLEHKPVPPATFVKHQLLTPKNVNLIYPLDNAGQTGGMRTLQAGAGRSVV